ncbi:MAG TPA: amidohydrolase [Victivallales bacterium]|nr:amidohydrolase [Victivallales bacterium]
MKTNSISEWVDNNSNKLTETSDKIWEYAELGLVEKKSSKLLSETLREYGFEIEYNVAGMPTAFKASWGKGSPVIGFLAEYDALAECFQDQGVFTKTETTGQGNGHGCGHNLLGVGVLGAILALQNELKNKKQDAKIILFGCPAEEKFIGKVFMQKAGVFDELDVALTWHPDRVNMVCDEIWQSMLSVKFNFHGIASHAATEPEKGRSALDAVELMNIGCNYLREHIDDQARIHYAITDGGKEPNTVPQNAQVWYYVRTSSIDQLEDVYTRVLKIADGAALMTETSVDVDLITVAPEILPNDTLCSLLSQTMLELPRMNWIEHDYKIAEEISKSFGPKDDMIIRKRLKIAGFEDDVNNSLLFEQVVPYKGIHPNIPGSSDVANVSWTVPSAQILTACNPFSTADHSWQYTASVITSIGHKGMLYASKVIGTTALKLIENPNLIEKAKQEFNQRTEGNKSFNNLISKIDKLPIK